MIENKVNTKKLKYSILRSLAVLFLVFLIIMSYIIIYSQNLNFENNNKKFHKAIHKTIHHTIEHNKNAYTYLLKRATTTANMQNFIVNNDRDKLYKILKPKFDLIQKENKYIKLLHLVRADGSSLLRVHKPTHIDDNLVSVRPTIKDMITNQKIISGYETGKYATAYRIIVPIYQKDKFIGSLGIGIDPNYFIDQIGEVLNERGFLFIKDKYLKLYSKKSNFNIQDYKLQSQVDTKILQILKELPRNYNFEDNIKIKQGENTYIIHTHSIQGFNEEVYGQYIFFQDITKLVDRQETMVVYLISALLLLILFVFLITTVYLHKFNIDITKIYNSLIDKLKNHEQELNDVKTRYEYAIDGTEDGLWDWNLVDDTIYFSPQWKKQLGYEDNELANDFSSWEQNVHPEDKDKAIADFSANIEKKTEVYENIHRLKHKDGSWIWIQDRGKTIFDKNGQAIRMVGFHTDITKRKLVEIELGQKEDMLIAQSRQAAMGEMISMIAHQWRQPLSVISMGSNNILADVELDTVNNNTLKSSANEILDQTQELSKTIDDFKSFFEPNKIKDIVLVSDVIKDTLKIIEKSLINNDIEIKCTYNNNNKVEIYSRELMQVFINIINNAKDALIDNQIENKKIIITEDMIDNMIVIKISDNAKGIPENILLKIFEPYFTTKKEQNGTGLGLYMSKVIVQKHLNGTIKAYNENDGAVFEIKLPYKKEN